MIYVITLLVLMWALHVRATAAKVVVTIVLTPFAVLTLLAHKMYKWVKKDRSVIEGEFQKVDLNQKCISAH